MKVDAAKRARIRALNDTFRSTFSGGQVVMTPGVANLSPDLREAILADVRAFAEFEGGDDPYQEHDFGVVERSDQRIIWKVDYYNKDMDGGSEDPADPDQTTRVLTIMRAEEY